LWIRSCSALISWGEIFPGAARTTHKLLRVLPKGIFKFENSAGAIPTTGNADTDWGLAEAYETGIAIFVFPQTP